MRTNERLADELEMAMMPPMAMSGWKAWRYHMAEKSPSVQPTRHLSVLTPARRHVGREAQKADSVTEGVLGLEPSDLLGQGACRVH